MRQPLQLWIHGDQTTATLDITDKFDKDQICYTKIDDGDDTLYLTIKYQNGFSCSGDKYPDPASFN